MRWYARQPWAWAYPGFKAKPVLPAPFWENTAGLSDLERGFRAARKPLPHEIESEAHSVQREMQHPVTRQRLAWMERDYQRALADPATPRGALVHNARELQWAHEHYHARMAREAA